VFGNQGFQWSVTATHRFSIVLQDLRRSENFQVLVHIRKIEQATGPRRTSRTPRVCGRFPLAVAKWEPLNPAWKAFTTPVLAGEDAFGSRDMVSETVTDLTDRYVMQDKLGLKLS